MTKRTLVLVSPSDAIIDDLDDADLPIWVAPTPMDASDYLLSLPAKDSEAQVLCYCPNTWGKAATAQSIKIAHKGLKLIVGRNIPAIDMGFLSQVASVLGATAIIDTTKPAGTDSLTTLVNSAYYKGLTFSDYIHH